MGYGRENSAGHLFGQTKEDTGMEHFQTTKRKSTDMGILEDVQLGHSMSNGMLCGILSSNEPTHVSRLPPAVAHVAKEDIRSYLHHKRVGNYLLGRTLGEGSFAKVKEGMHVLTGEKVAIKVIDKKKARADAYVSKNMRREARILQSLNHPNVVKLYEIIETENSYYLVTELCSGGELMQHIYKHQFLKEPEVRKYIRQIVSAVDHLHKSNIVHRDLKVENLLLDEAMNIKIIDFGLSNQYEVSLEDGSTEFCTTQCGSPAYAAPELLGQKKYGPEVDTWSIGVNMYAMLTGCLPFTVEPFNITALHAKMLDNKINEIPERLSPECRQLISLMLVPKPEERISIADICRHPWLQEGTPLGFQLHPFPSTPTHSSINMEIVQHIVHTMRMEKTSEEMVIDALIACRATPSSAAYKLLEQRLVRYMRTQRPRRSSMGGQYRTSRKTRSVCSTNDEDLASPEPPHESTTQKKKASTLPSRKYLEKRRMSAPVHMLEEDFKHVDFDSRPSTKTGSRFPNPHMKRVQTDPSLTEPRPITVGGPRNATGGVTRKGSTGHIPHKHNAWDTRKSSSDGSEPVFEDGNGKSGFEHSPHISPTTSSPQGSKPTFSIGSGNLENWVSGLPNISPSRNPSASSSKKKSTDYYFNRMGSAKRKVSISKDGRSEVSTRMPLDAIASELVRVVSNLNALDIQLKGPNSFVCDFHRIKVQITLWKDLPNLCQLQFELASGSDYKTFHDICKEILQQMEV